MSISTAVVVDWVDLLRKIHMLTFREVKLKAHNPVTRRHFRVSLNAWLPSGVFLA